MEVGDAVGIAVGDAVGFAVGLAVGVAVGVAVEAGSHAQYLLTELCILLHVGVAPFPAGTQWLVLPTMPGEKRKPVWSIVSHVSEKLAAKN